jgi:hypothetical protein
LLDTREKLLDIREKLAGRLLVGDGAVGTLLADRGVDQPYYKAKLTHTQIVRDVHEEYLRAGARVIETNIFLANRLKLADYNLEDLERALEKIEEMNLEILLGLMPLRSGRQAEFLHHEVPGINIPKHVRQKLARLSNEDAPKYGVEVAQNQLLEAKPLVGGAYLMPPASMPHLAGDVIEPIVQES